MEYNKIKKCLIAGYDLDIITQEEMGILWNYITNLQEQIKATEEVSAEYIKRNDKAIEYINKLKNFEIKYVIEEKKLYASEKDFVKDLLNILKGSNKE